MKELGEYLKHARQSNGVSVEEAAEDLELSTSQLENIESGNTRAFKDVYNLKQYVKNYAKYLGLNPDEVADEFNSFLFEHTSKISLDDIKQAQKSLEVEETKKVKSPYTKEYKKKVNPWPIIVIILIIIFLVLGIYFIIKIISQSPVRDSELIRKVELYEYT